MVEFQDDPTGKNAILQIDSFIAGIANLFSKLSGGNCVVGCVAVRFEHFQMLVRYAGYFERPQSSLELFFCCNWFWITEFVCWIVFNVNFIGLCKQLGNRIWIVTLKLFKTFSLYKSGEPNRGFETSPECSNALWDDIKLCNNDENGQPDGSCVIHRYRSLLNMNLFLPKKSFQFRYGLV